MASASRLTNSVEVISGEHFRFHVQSRTGNKRHLVDLEEHAWNGACSCEHFEYRMLPELVRGAQPSARLRCWHINAARDIFVRTIGPMLAKALNETPNETKHAKKENPPRHVAVRFPSPGMPKASEIDWY